MWLAVGGIRGGRAAFLGSTLALGTDGPMVAWAAGARWLCGTGRRCIWGAETRRVKELCGFEGGTAGDE